MRVRLVPSSLSGRLVATTVTLVALVGLLLSSLVAVAMNAYLTDQLDDKVTDSLERAIALAERGPGLPEKPPQGDDREGEVPGGIGQGPGTVTALIGDGWYAGDVITESPTRRELSTSALEALAAVEPDGEVHTVDLPALGGYRVVAYDAGGAVLVSGLPRAEISETMESLIGWEVLLTLAGTAVAAAAATFLVRHQLQPLREVAATAHEVAELPLSTGEIEMTSRVPERLTDPRTEVGQVGAALNSMLGHVERALQSRHESEQQVRQFVADASHELRTPLATIHGYAELSRRTSPPDAGQLSQAMTKVESEAGRMSALVEDLLLLARLDAGRPLARAEVDLTKMVLEAVGDTRVVDSEHRWVMSLPEEPVVVVGDEQRLHQVLSNLLTNARRHTPPGTTVTVGAADGEDGTALLTVHDDGPGIPERIQGRVFERFVRDDSSRNRTSGGVGLGLSLVRAITEAHGGRVGVESVPGSTQFTVTLPVDQP